MSLFYHDKRPILIEILNWTISLVKQTICFHGWRLKGFECLYTERYDIIGRRCLKCKKVISKLNFYKKNSNGI